MASYANLDDFSEIDGFIGVAIFESESAPPVAEYENPNASIHLRAVGQLANHVMINAKDAARLTKSGHCNMIHVIATNAHIFVKSLGKDTETNVVLVTKKEANQGMAKSYLKRYGQ